ncbi:MAG: hypothetical protein EAZ91_05930 [Cytophagales bacterium]|nr:MAG: hypothetical protein EAZ91_05930 [Cytophagales bacterium]
MLFNADTHLIVAIQLGVATLLASLANWLLVSDTLYFNAYAEQLSYEQIQGLLQQGERYQWIGYVLVPVVYLLKLTLVGSCLSLCLYLWRGQFQFGACFRVAAVAETVFWLSALGKVLWFLLVQTDYNLQDLQYFFPLSALNLFDHQTLDPWLVYPLQLLNVFEMLYWLMLAYGLVSVAGVSFERGIGMVASSYGAGLLLWVVLVMFLTVSLT